MRYVIARYNKHQRELAYRFYITDALRSISENSAKYGGGSYVRARFSDIIYPSPVDDRTSEEVIDHIRGGLSKLRGE